MLTCCVYIVTSTEAVLQLQVIQAVSLVVLFIALGFRLSEHSEGSGAAGNTDSFRQQLTHILTSPQTVQEVSMPAVQSSASCPELLTARLNADCIVSLGCLSTQPARACVAHQLKE